MATDKEDPTTLGTVRKLVSMNRADAGAVSRQTAYNLDGNLSDSQGGSEDGEILEVWERLQAADMLVPGSPLGQEVVDEYRRIKRPLLSNAFGKTASLVDRGNLILVTSSLPNEGKSYTSLNLAMAIAQERDNTVLFIDCDINKRGSSKLLGVEDRPGLSDILENNRITIGDAMMRTDIPGLAVCPAGKYHEYVTEMLASQRMIRLVDEIATRYTDRVIIIDAPPLLPTPQTQVIAGLVGQIVFVIEAGKTPQAAVKEAMEMLPEDKAVGIVLNKSESTSARGGYYHSYYGPYGD